MDSDITYQEYWNEIKSIAQSVLEEYDGEESQNDGVHETVDSHQWVIYNAYHFDVLKHCSDENAYFEMFEEAPAGECVSDITVKLAHAALLNDAQIALQDLRDEVAANEVEA